MNKMKALAAGFGLAALTVIGLACGNGETPTGAGPGETLVTPPETVVGQTPEQLAPPPASMGSMVPRPKGIEQLVERASVVVLGTVSTVLEERRIGGYGDDGRLMPPGEGGAPVTDYEVRIESVLKGDGVVENGGTLILRMGGHRNSQDGAITSVVFKLPEPGDHLLFALGTNLDGTYGSGPEGLLNVDGDVVTFADGVSFCSEVSPDKLMQGIGAAVTNGEAPAGRGPGETLVAPPVTVEDQPIGQGAPSPATLGSMMPRPNSIEQLVERTDVVVLGTVGAVLEERQIGGYGEDGQLTPAGEGGIPMTDYEVRIESVLKGDGVVENGGTLVLRMFGHRSAQGGAITSVAFKLPEPGDHLLIALGTNPDGTYGSGPEGLLNVDGDVVTFADGVSFGSEMSPDQLMQGIRAAVTN